MINPEYGKAMELFLNGCAELSIEPGEEAVARFESYLHALMTLPYNLTAIRTPEDCVTHHFLDSIAALPLLRKIRPGRTCDVGTGGGFPLLPLKILEPSLDVTFIDSRTKSTMFIDSLCTKWSLQNWKTIHDHTSQLRKHPPQPFDAILTRAFSDIATTLEETLFLLRPQGTYILYKGPLFEEELAKTPAKLLSQVDVISTDRIRVPFLDKTRHLVILRKR